jgi:hypothetical protein
MDALCKNCKHFHDFEFTTQSRGLGECRIRAPLVPNVVYGPDDVRPFPSATWPAVWDFEWCGEWTAKGKPVTAAKPEPDFG